jgi:hypothetical protein
MKTLIWVGLCLTLSACAALPNIANIFFGGATETYPPGELYKYRGELLLTFEGQTFEGVGATKLTGPIDIRVDSKFGLDRLQFTSCSRHEVIRDFDETWFSKSKTYTYHYVPSKDELVVGCPLYIEAFSKKALAAWGFIVFGHDESLPGRMSCNGESTLFKQSSHSVCQTKAGLDQSLRFDEPIDDFEADSICNMKKVDPRTFTMRPGLGMCTATFLAKGKWHSLNLIGYERVLVQDE